MDQNKRTDDKQTQQPTGHYDSDQPDRPDYGSVELDPMTSAKIGQAGYDSGQTDYTGTTGDKGTTGQADPTRKPFQDADEIEKETPGESR